MRQQRESSSLPLARRSLRAAPSRGAARMRPSQPSLRGLVHSDSEVIGALIDLLNASDAAGPSVSDATRHSIALMLEQRPELRVPKLLTRLRAPRVLGCDR